MTIKTIAMGWQLYLTGCRLGGTETASLTCY